MTTTDAGGPLDIVRDRETGLVVAPTVEELARACVWLRDHTDEARTLGRAGPRHRARGDVGRVHRPAARGGRVKVAYFSPLPPSTSGIADYSALLLPALERLVDVEVVRPGRTRPVADADVALYHVGNDPDAHAWIVDALRRRPGVVVLHDFVIHHLVAGMTIGRHDGHAYLAAMEREAGVAGRMLGWGVLEGRVPPLWEIRPTEFPLAGEVLDRATGVIVHSRYVEAHVREHGYDGPLWRIAHPGLARARRSSRRTIDGAPLFGCFGHLNESKRIPQLLRAFAEFRARASGRAPPARRRRGARLRPRRAARAARPRRRGRDPRAVRRGGAALGADVGLRRVRPPARADDGRDVRQRDPHAVARQAARRQRRRLVRGAARRRRAQGARRRRARSRRSSRPSTGSRSPASPRGWARRRGPTCAPSTISTAWPRSTSPRSSRRPARARSRRRSSAPSPRRRRTRAPTRRGSRRSSPRSGSRARTDTSRCQTPGRGSLRTWPMWAWLGGALCARGRRAARARSARRLAVDHGRRARLLRHGAELREHGPLPHPRRARELRLRLSAAALARVQALRVDDRRLPVGARAQRARDVLRRLPDVSPRAARRASRLRARRGGARRRDPVDDLHRHADDGERVLSDLHVARVRARARARAADAQATARRCSRSARSRSSRARRRSRSSRRSSRRRSRSRGSSAAARAGSARGSRPTRSSRPPACSS